MKVEHYILCLDTNEYAGNFERETTAYATGRVGECGVGDADAQSFRDETEEAEVPAEIIQEMDKVTNVPDDNGCWRPAAIQKDSKGVYDSVGIYLEETFSPEALKLVLTRAESYLEQRNVKLLGVRLVTKFTDEKSEVINWK